MDDNAFLFEATFDNPTSLSKHYKQHVLGKGESFDPLNPKFPRMTKSEYAKRAEQLSLASAAASSAFGQRYVGFVVSHPNGERCIKFKVRSSIYDNPSIRASLQGVPGTYCDVVVYVEDELVGNQIITYYVGRPGKISREKQNLVGELPNKQSKAAAFRKLQQLESEGGDRG